MLWVGTLKGVDVGDGVGEAPSASVAATVGVAEGAAPAELLGTGDADAAMFGQL
ncbi:MAG: hypothetical protein IAI50_16205 [Candidatus Eremiobacteraeota bacterium]|nr:hypothetical protein [Candidatus Eremiobacteraeota bacterium]